MEKPKTKTQFKMKYFSIIALIIGLCFISIDNFHLVFAVNPIINSQNSCSSISAGSSLACGMIVSNTGDIVVVSIGLQDGSGSTTISSVSDGTENFILAESGARNVGGSYTYVRTYVFYQTVTVSGSVTITANIAGGNDLASMSMIDAINVPLIGITAQNQSCAPCTSQYYAPLPITITNPALVVMLGNTAFPCGAGLQPTGYTLDSSQDSSGGNGVDFVFGVNPIVTPSYALTSANGNCTPDHYGSAVTVSFNTPPCCTTITQTITAYNTVSLTNSQWIPFMIMLLVPTALMWSISAIGSKATDKEFPIGFLTLITLLFSSILGLLAGINPAGTVSFFPFGVVIFFGFIFGIYLVKSRGN